MSLILSPSAAHRYLRMVPSTVHSRPAMTEFQAESTRRCFLAAVASSSLVAAGAPDGGRSAERAQIAITFDLEMSRHYPTWDQTHWDYEKGNLDRDTKRYSLEAARRVRKHGGRIHFFALGQTLEQENTEWLRELAGEGHPIGNHTYDHVNVKATKPEDIQFRFRRAPWLVEGKTPAAVIEENVRLMARALKERVRIEPAGFRTPGGFANGLSGRPALQAMLVKQGYRWVSSKYPRHPTGTPGQPPGPGIIADIVAAQAEAQAFVYPSGLIEVPMSPISDVSAFRSARW